MRNVCVQGLGFVGAATALAVASARDLAGRPHFRVTGVERDTAEGRRRAAALTAGAFPFRCTDPALDGAARQAAETGNLTATTDPSAFGDADIVLVDVNLDVADGDNGPEVDFTGFCAAVDAIGRRIRPHTLVLVETTVPPGTCEKIVAPALQRAFLARGLPADSVRLAYAYERVMPGPDYLRSLTHFWRVYAGHTDEAAAACRAFLEDVVDTVGFPPTRLASTTACETAKVLENSYRAANIAFVAEWGRFAEAVGVDLFEAIAAIRIRPTHANIRQPGLGVGGYCLTKDPLMGLVAARDLFGRDDLAFPFSQAAVATNRAMPLAAAERLQALLGGSLEGRRILLLGVAYRDGVADSRNAPSETFAIEVRRRGGRVRAHDPLIDHWQELDLPTGGPLPPAQEFDAVVLAVAHTAYRELDVASWLGGARPAVLDANAVLDEAQRQRIADLGCRFAAIGRGTPQRRRAGRGPATCRAS